MWRDIRLAGSIIAFACVTVNAQAIGLWTQLGGSGCAGTVYIIDTYYGGECINLPSAVSCWNNVYIAPEYAHLHLSPNCGGGSDLINLNLDFGNGASSNNIYRSIRLTRTPTSSSKRELYIANEISPRGADYSVSPEGYYWYQNNGWITTVSVYLSSSLATQVVMPTLIPALWLKLDQVGKKYTNVNSFFWNSIAGGTQLVSVSVRMASGKDISVGNIKFICQELMKYCGREGRMEIATTIRGANDAAIGDISIIQSFTS